jgi:hypothetical protein
LCLTSLFKIFIFNSVVFCNLFALDFNSAKLTLLCAVISSASLFALLSANFWPCFSTASDSALYSNNIFLNSSSSDSSINFCRLRFPLASWLAFSANYFALASCDFVVISIANFTDWYKEALVDSSSGSTDWISTVNTDKPFSGKSNDELSSLFSSIPNIASLIKRAYALWNASNFYDATTVLTLPAITLHISPT